MKRKIYDDLLEWKQTSSGSTALLIDGARRVGKSYIVEKFAIENYASYILIDFNRAGKEVTDLFVNYLDDLDSLFMYLSAYYNFLPITRIWRAEDDGDQTMMESRGLWRAEDDGEQRTMESRGPWAGASGYCLFLSTLPPLCL